ncbi:MAG: thioredoxin-like domain-containing protein [Flavobacteriales bacterium]|nr:thioredoxin-like domain-containing protein [Flavobacteriales bacterium]
MKKFLLVVLSLGFFTNSLKAQKIEGKFQANYPGGDKIELHIYEGNKTKKVSEVNITNGRQFIFKNEKRPVGLYKIKDPKTKQGFDIILNNQKEIMFFFNSNSLRESSVSELENSLYTTYQNSLRRKNIVLQGIKKNLSIPNLSQEKRKAYMESIQKTEMQHFKKVSELVDKGPKTFFTAMILALDPDNKKEMSKFWDDYDFKDTRLLNTPVLSKRLSQFIVRYGQGQKYKMMDCVDEFMGRAKVTQEVYEFAAYQMLEGFHNSGFKDISKYIMDEYIYGEDCGGDFKVSDLLKKKGESFKKLSVGAVTFDFKAPDDKGKNIRFSDIVSKNNYTMLFFWSSWCKHCEEQMPEIERLYDVLKKHKVEFVAFSMDNYKAAWQDALKKQKKDWVNVSDLKKWDSPIADDFRVIKTPSFFIVNNKRQLVAAPRHIGEAKKVFAKIAEIGGL